MTTTTKFKRIAEARAYLNDKGYRFAWYSTLTGRNSSVEVFVRNDNVATLTRYPYGGLVVTESA